VYPALYIYTGWLYTETLSTFLQTAACYCLFRVLRARGQSWRLWALSGVLLGLLSLEHPNGILVLALVILWSLILVWRRRLPPTALWGTALAVLLACILVGPWILRDYVVSHSFVLVASGSGTVLLGAYNTMAVTDQQHLGGWIGPGQSDPQVTTPFTSHVCPAPCEVALESAETDAAIQWIRSHPDDLSRLMLYHLKNFFTPYTPEADMPLNRFPRQVSSQVVLAMSNTLPIPIFLLAGLGVLVTLRRYWDQLLFAYLVILGTLAEILVFYGNARFRSPIEPLLIVLGAGALWWLLESQPGTLRWALRQRAFTV
jgi:4-amino-4-deoxy-L-arabinose transferase-like glycosyltransferase